MRQPSDEDEEMRRAVRAADAAEEELRKLKEQLIPRDRADALNSLLEAELRAMIARETAKFRPAIRAAMTQEEARDVVQQLSDSMVAGTERVKAEMMAQMHAWSLAGLEDHSKEDEGL